MTHDLISPGTRRTSGLNKRQVEDEDDDENEDENARENERYLAIVVQRTQKNGDLEGSRFGTYFVHPRVFPAARV